MVTISLEDGVGASVMTWMRQTICGLHGHDSLLHFEHDRMSLRCVSCGHESPGWELSDHPKDDATVAPEVPRRSVLRPNLVGARRVA
jgi:hypothetical protein